MAAKPWPEVDGLNICSASLRLKSMGWRSRPRLSEEQATAKGLSSWHPDHFSFRLLLFCQWKVVFRYRFYAWPKLEWEYCALNGVFSVFYRFCGHNFFLCNSFFAAVLKCNWLIFGSFMWITLCITHKKILCIATQYTKTFQSLFEVIDFSSQTKLKCFSM